MSNSKPANKKNFAQKFAKQLEEHLAFGDKLAKSLSNPNIANVQTPPVDQNTTDKTLPTYGGSAGKEDDQAMFTARVRDYIEKHETKNVSSVPNAQVRQESPSRQYRSPEKSRNAVNMSSSNKKRGNRQGSSEDRIRNKDDSCKRKSNPTEDRNEPVSRIQPPSRLPYSSVEGRLPLSLPKRIQPGSDSRKEGNVKSPEILNSSVNGLQGGDGRRSESGHYEVENRLSHSESKSVDMTQGSVKTGIEPASYLFPNMEKNISFKKKIISDSMQRLKNSVYNSGVPTRENSAAHELALRQVLANTSLTYDNGESILDKSNLSRDQLTSDENRGRNEDRTVQEKYYKEMGGRGTEEGDGSMIQLKDLIKRGSYGGPGGSERESFNHLFRPSETTEGYVMNVSRLGELDDPMEIQERIEELRRYSMELGMGIGDYGQESGVKENVYGKNGENNTTATEQVSENVSNVEAMKSLRTPDFQNYAGNMKDNHFFALQKADGGQKKVEGTKMAIIKRFSEELQKGLGDNRVPVPQVRPMGPQDGSEYQESQEMMGFLSFSKEDRRTDETVQSPEGHGYEVQGKYRQEREQFNERRNLKEEEKGQESNPVEEKLDETASKVNIKTFLALRSILKPHRAIVLCCEGLLKLLAGFEDIPLELEEKEGIEWNQIKALFNSPVKFVNLVSSFKKFVNNGEISYQKIEAVELVLSRIQVHLDAPLHESFTQIHNFLTTAVQYYENCFQESYKGRGDAYEEPERVRPVPVQYTEAPRSRPNIPVAQTYNKPAPSVPKRSAIQSRYSPGKYSPQKASPAKIEANRVQRQAKSVGRGIQNIQNRPTSTVEKQSNAVGNKSGQENRRQESVGTKRTGQVKSASRTPVKKRSDSDKMENKRVVLGQKKLEENYEKEEVEQDEGEVRDGVRFIVDVEQSEAGELRDTIEEKEKEAREYRNRVKKMLFEHDRFVKKFLKQQENLEDEINREHAIEEWRKTNEMKADQEEFEREWRHARNADYINEKKEVKEIKEKEEKENMNEVLLESLQDHYYNSFMLENKKENKKKELREKYKSVMADKISKKQKETMESISQKEELAQRRRDHYKGRKIDIDNEKNKWQNDYIMLSKLIGNAK